MKRLYRPRDLCLRPAESSDAKFLYRLLVERYETGITNIEGMAAQELPSYEEHCAYLATDPYRRLEVISTTDDPDVGVGMMYLTRDRVGGCFVQHSCSGRGIGPAACFAFFSTCSLPVIAHFNPQNRAGYRMADRTGWILVERLPNRLTYELRQPPTDPFAQIDRRGRSPS